MIRVYSSPNPAMVHLARHALENEGIGCIVRGEHLAGASGGVAPIDAWVELWIEDDVLARAAHVLLSELFEEDAWSEDDPWICPDCIEWREGPFARCWKCGASRVD